MTRFFLYLLALCLILTCLNTNTFAAPETLNVRDFGATGDGTTDDAPAFQKALDALAVAGGGTLFVPEGKYVIASPVSKNFNGLASSITITGVESLTMPAPPTAGGNQLCQGLDLPTEVYPRTGEANVAISISGLRNLVVKDIAFVGTQTARTDAAVTLELTDIDKAQVRHSEFYGLLTLVPGGGIVKALRTDLEISLSKFLGSTATSGWYVPLVENLQWRGVTITDTTFLDYGCRPDFFSKTGIAAPISWINIGNAAQPTNVSPRREVVLRNVFLDEGGYWGLSSLPYRYLPESAPIDLIYVTGLYMNVSNFGQFGHNIYDARRVFIEKSQYGWSHNAAAAIGLNNVGTAILDQLTCVAHADHIYADQNTRELIVLNSTYAQLDSFAHNTVTINTPTEEDDPVQYVRARFAEALERVPDPAAHFYWSNLLIHCSSAACIESTKQEFNGYLSAHPAPTFTISGGITDNNGAALAGATVTLSGSQSVTTTTDASGNYFFTNLPTSGEYVVTASKNEYTFNSPTATFITPSGDRTADFTAQLTASLKKFSISGRVVTSNGAAMAGVLVTLSGSVNRTTTTTPDGVFSFTDIAGGSSCTVMAAKDGYVMSPLVQTFNNLGADASAEFEATKLPVLLTVPDSNRAVALELTQFLSGPFPINSTLLSDGRNRTRIIIFGTDLGLLPGENFEAITAEAEDAAGIRYPLRVEFVSPLAELPQVSQIVVRLSGALEDTGEVLISITVHGRTSNKVRIGIQP